MELRRYSREQELEADRVGLGYLTKAGWRGDAIVTLVEKLRRQSDLEGKLMGEESAEPGGKRNALSTHPEPDERLAALGRLDAARLPGESDPAGYLGLIDGMSVDDRPEEGFVRGTTFLHPTMRFAFTAPADFRLFNDADAVLGLGSDRSALLFSCSPGRVEGSLADWMRDKLKPTPTDIQTTEIDGVEAAIGSKPRGADTGLGQLRYVLIRRDEGFCYFNLLSDGADRDRKIEALIRTARSYRTLSPAEASGLQPYRLHVVARDGMSAQQLARRLPYRDLPLARLLALNGVDNAAEFARRREVKLIEP